MYSKILIWKVIMWNHIKTSIIQTNEKAILHYSIIFTVERTASDVSMFNYLNMTQWQTLLKWQLIYVKYQINSSL